MSKGVTTNVGNSAKLKKWGSRLVSVQVKYDPPCADIEFDKIVVTFEDIGDDMPVLSKRHIETASQWDNGMEMLLWAALNEASVEEMQAWRRATEDR